MRRGGPGRGDSDKISLGNWRLSTIVTSAQQALYPAGLPAVRVAYVAPPAKWHTETLPIGSLPMTCKIGILERSY